MYVFYKTVQTIAICDSFQALLASDSFIYKCERIPYLNENNKMRNDHVMLAINKCAWLKCFL